VVEGQATSRQNEACIPIGHSNGNARWHECSAVRGNCRGFTGSKIDSRIAWLHSNREWQSGVEKHHAYRCHLFRLGHYPPFSNGH